MKDNISRSSIFRDSMRIAAKKKKEEREKNIKKVATKRNLRENKNIGKEPGE